MPKNISLHDVLEPLKQTLLASRDVIISSGRTKRDKLKGTNARNSQFFADFRRFLLIFAFPGNYSILEAQIFAENRRFSQKTAENRRFLQKPVCPI